MLVAVILAGMISSLGWAETMMPVPIGPRIDSTTGLAFGHAQSDVMFDLVPWAINTIREAVSIDVGRGPAFFSNYKFAGQDFGGPIQVVSSVGAGFNFIPGLFAEYRLQHFSDAGAYGPYKAGVNVHLLEINFRF